MYLGISFETYNNMVGGRRWAHLSPYAWGNIICKADVLIAYRMLDSIRPIYEDMKLKRMEKK